MVDEKHQSMALLASQGKTQEALLAKNDELRSLTTALRKELTDKGLMVTELEGMNLMAYSVYRSLLFVLVC